MPGGSGASGDDQQVTQRPFCEIVFVAVGPSAASVAPESRVEDTDVRLALIINYPFNVLQYSAWRGEDGGWAV